MSENQKKPFGRIAWTDLTVPEAGGLMEFYSAVAGWRSKPHDMGEYNDFEVLAPGSEEVIAGICHARGVNADIPPQWLIYITVEDLEASIAACERNGGKVLTPVKKMGVASLCVIQDPAGAVAALFQPA